MVSWTKGTFIVIAIVHALIIFYGLKPAVVLRRDDFVYFFKWNFLPVAVILCVVVGYNIIVYATDLIWKDLKKIDFVKEM